MFAEFCDLLKQAYTGSTWIVEGCDGDMVAGTADAYLGLDFVYLCCKLGVSWSTLDPRELCGTSDVNAGVGLWTVHAMHSRPSLLRTGQGQGTHTPAEAAFTSAASALLRSASVSVSSARALTLCSGSASRLSCFETNNVAFPESICAYMQVGKGEEVCAHRMFFE